MSTQPAVGPIRTVDMLGLASAGLAAPMLVTPRRFLRAIGVEDDGRSALWAAAVGVRELTATLNINVARQRRIGAWSRVAGDAMDLALLAAAYRTRRRDETRLLGALGAVGGIMLVDLAAGAALSRAERTRVRDGSGSSGRGMDARRWDPGRVRLSVTIRRPPDEVRLAFADFTWSALDESASVRFVPAPGRRGTELHVELGRRGRNPLAARGRSAHTSDELRRFKAQLETGVPVVSDKAPEGPSTPRQVFHKARPAQPVGS